MQPTTPNAMQGRGITWELESESESESPQASPPASPPTSRVVLPITVDVGIQGIHWDYDDSPQASAPTNRSVSVVNIGGVQETHGELEESPQASSTTNSSVLTVNIGTRGTHWELEESPSSSRSVSSINDEAQAAGASAVVDKCSCCSQLKQKKVGFEEKVTFIIEIRGEPEPQPSTSSGDNSQNSASTTSFFRFVDAEISLNESASQEMPAQQTRLNLASQTTQRLKGLINFLNSSPIPGETLLSMLKTLAKKPINDPSASPERVFLETMMLPPLQGEPNSKQPLGILRRIANINKRFQMALELNPNCTTENESLVVDILRTLADTYILGYPIAALDVTDDIERELFNAAMSSNQQYREFCIQILEVLAKIELIDQIIN